ncbi:MAG: chemotaxis protein CheB [Isosphaeraceae bacterium]
MANSKQVFAEKESCSGEPLRDGESAVEVLGDRKGESPHYVVGIGASAGGLEAIERFFDHVPLTCGLSFVLVQHLSPDFKSLMDELLARHTKIAIHRVEQGMPIERDAIYLIPPKTNMMLEDGRLWLSDQEPKSGLNLPIDIFLRSLAQAAGSRAIGVILSGTGSDGSRGIREIHEKGGLVVVQDPDTAGFDGMPKAAIGTGVVDLVLPPEEMPGRILQYMGHPAGLGAADRDLAAGDDLTALFTLLRRRFAVDFTLYKPGTIARRLERRMSLCAIGTLADYVKHLEEAPDEVEALYRDLLVEVTQFFRDHLAFDLIEKEVIPRLFEQSSPDDGIRVWVPGCATGEEAYSVAILLHAYREFRNLPVDIKVFATDVHRSSLDVAANGIYGEHIANDVAPALLSRYFIKKREKFVVSPELRQMVLFAPHNLVKDPPFTRLDLITCRNLLIYLNPPTQKRVLSLFQFGLKTDGFLFLGPSESLADNDGEFEALSERWKIFQKRRDVRLGGRLGPFHSVPDAVAQVNQRLSVSPARSELAVPAVYEALLARFVPSGLLVDEHHQLLHAFGTARRYLRLPEGRATSDVLRMVDDDLRMAISSAVHRAGKEQVEIAYSGVKVSLDDEESRLRVTAVPLSLGRLQASLFLVRLDPDQQPELVAQPAESFDAQGESADRIRQLEQELVYTKEHLQTTIEELEASNEELQSTNEELVASNEELQSTNEELHSVNEELYTVNAEYQKKIDELTQLTNDIDNLLYSTDIGTVFLDNDLSIRKFTPSIARVFNLLPMDIGRPLKHISNNIRLEHDTLLGLIERMRADGQMIVREVGGPAGEIFLMRILPYRTQDNLISGSVLTFVDITAIKQAQHRLESNERRLYMALEAGGICTWEWRISEDRFVVDRQFATFFGIDESSFSGTLGAFIALADVKDQAQLRQALYGSVGTANRIETEIQASTGLRGTRFVVVRADVDRDHSGRAVRLFGVCIDVTEQKRADMALQESQQLLKAILDNSLSTIFAKDLQGRYLFINHPFPTHQQTPRDELLGKSDAELFAPEVAVAHVAEDQRVIATACPLQTEETYHCSDGPHAFLKTKFPLVDGQGKIRGVGGICTDITPLKRAEIDAREALVRRDTFLAMLSHELRNPLGTILNANYLLLNKSVPEQARREALQIIRGQGELMSHLLDDLLDVSRLTQDKIRFRDDVVNLVQVVDEAARVTRNTIENAGLTLVTQLADEPLYVRGDAVRLQQMVVNLLNNAAKYTLSGGSIKLSATRDVDEAEIRVQDTGIGIQPEMLERVFDLFVQADPGLDRSEGGMGVGLTLVRAIVERHGGRITALSAGRDRGSEFVVRLPLSQNPPAAVHCAGDVSSPGTAVRSVVIVEDSNDSRRMLETLLRLEGCEVKSAGNGEEGLSTILESRPDLALVDIGLPGLSGYDLAREVRRQPGNESIRLIALTGYGRAEDRQHVLEAGFDAHLVKPLKWEDLSRVLRGQTVSSRNTGGKRPENS